MATRVGWGIADQALSSLTNFALGIVVARAVTAAEFGAFSLAFASYLLALGVVRAISSQPLVIRYATAQVDQWRGATRRSTGAALAVGLAAGVPCLVVAMLTDGATAGAWGALGLTLPALMVQDCWRFAFFARGDARAAFLNDLVWAIALVVGLGAAMAAGGLSVFAATAIWGLSAGVAALYAHRQAGTRPAISATSSWWQEHRDVIPAYVGEFGSGAGASQIGVFAIGGVASVTAVGALRAADILMGPLRSFQQAIRQVAQPEAVRVRAGSGRVVRACALVSAGLAVIAVLAGVVLIPVSRLWGPQLLGDTWRIAHPVLLPLTVSIVAAGVLAGAQMGLHAYVAVRRTLVSRVVLSVMLVAFKVIGAAAGGAVGAAVGGAVAMWLGATMWWIQLLVVARGATGATSDGQDEAEAAGATTAETISMLAAGSGSAATPNQDIAG